MLECVNGNGQGCCDICMITNGWHRHWSSSLYYIKNTKGYYLRNNLPYAYSFSDDENLLKAAFCYKHALFVEETRKQMTDY